MYAGSRVGGGRVSLTLKIIPVPGGGKTPNICTINCEPPVLEEPKERPVVGGISTFGLLSLHQRVAKWTAILQTIPAGHQLVSAVAGARFPCKVVSGYFQVKRMWTPEETLAVRPLEDSFSIINLRLGRKPVEVLIPGSGIALAVSVGDLDPEHPTDHHCAAAFAHECIHFLHDANGTNLERYDNVHDCDNGWCASVEEQQTIGLGPYADDPLTENRVREQLGLPLRTSWHTLPDPHARGK